MTGKLNDRIDEIMNTYEQQHKHSKDQDPITREEAVRLVEGLIEMGRTEDEALERLQYCTGIEDEQERRISTLFERVEDLSMLSQMIVQKVGHIGVLIMSIFVYREDQSRGKNLALSRGLVLLSMILLVADDISQLKLFTKKA